MTQKLHVGENLEELALIKVAAWTWYRHGQGSEQRITSERDYTESCDVVLGPSRYKLEAMDKAHEDRRVSTRYINNPLFSTASADSNLLDVYEIERISKDLDHYIECSCDKYCCRKSIDGVHDPGSLRIVPLKAEDFSSTKAKRTDIRWNWFRKISGLCRSNKGDVVENVGVGTGRRRGNTKHIPVGEGGDWNFHWKGASV
ncbi:hypothetical protein LXL04_024855 [Taraxacum kok-saghyz]